MRRDVFLKKACSFFLIIFLFQCFNIGDTTRALDTTFGDSVDYSNIEIVSCDMSAYEAGAGENIFITLKIKALPDNTKSIKLFYNEDLTNKEDIKYLYSEDGETFKGNVERIGKYDFPGKRTLKYIEVKGNNGYDMPIYIYNRSYSDRSNIVRDLDNLNYVVKNNANYDGTAPLIKKIYVDKDKVKPGEKVNVYFEIIEPSGIRSSNIDYSERKGLKLRHIKDNLYCATIEITPYDKSGLWTMDSIRLQDNFSNFYIGINLYSKVDMSKGNFTVYDTIPDSERNTPKILKVYDNKAILARGEKTSIFIELDRNPDTIEEITAFMASKLLDPIEDTERPFKFKFIGNKKYEAKIDFYDITSDSSWSLKRVNIVDKLGKSIVYVNNGKSVNGVEPYDFSNVYIKYKMGLGGNNIYIKDLSINKKELGLNDILEVNAKVEDFSSIINTIKVDFSLNNKLQKEVTLYKTASGEFKGSMNIDKYMNAGLWKLNKLNLIDDIGGSWLDTRLSNYSVDFIVKDTIKDEEAPYMKNIYVSKALIGPNETVKVYVRAEDKDSGIKSIKGIYTLDYEGEKPVTFRHVSEDLYEADFKLGSYGRNGTYFMHYMMLEDNAGNQYNIESGKFKYTEYKVEDLSNSDIVAVGFDKLDDKGPMVKSLKIKNNKLCPGSKLNLISEVGEELSGIECFKASCEQLGSGNKKEVYFEKLKDNTYEGKLDIGKDMTGLWYINEVYISDIAGNKSTESYDKSYLTFNVDLNQEPTADVNRDGVVDIKDLATIAMYYNTTSKDESWDLSYDLNRDDIIDIYDITKVARYCN